MRSSARSWSPYGVLALSLLLTCLAAYYLIATAELKDRLRFENNVQRVQALIEHRMDTYLALLRAGSGFFTAEDLVTADQFKRFVDKLELAERYPTIRGIGFSRRIAPAERAAMEAAQRKVFPGFRIWPAHPRPEVHAIVYFEPLRNSAGLGFDMATEPARRTAMERARDTGQAAATGKVRLVLETEPLKQPAFLIYVPVYRRGLPLATVEDRRAALEGFVYAPFRSGDLLRDLLPPATRPNIAFQVFAAPEPRTADLLYESQRIDPDHQPHFRLLRRLDLAGAPWTIAYSTLPSFEASSGRSQAWLVLVLGLITSAILFALARSQVHALARAEQAADGLRQSEEALRQDIAAREETDKRLREEAGISETLHSIGLAAAAELDLRNLAQTIVDATTRITGARFGAFFYHLVDERGELFREHALSGEPPEGIEDFLRPRDPATPTPMFRGEGVRRIDDVLDDSMFGRLSRPLEGRPARWPIRSYLTTPVVSRSGELLGGFFFGHPEPGAFSERVERILGGIAAQAAVAIDNARLYEAERRARAEAETANQAKDRFMATLSHELRTPLAPVLAVISGLEMEELDPGVRERLSTIRRNVELEARLIDDLLDLTRITRGKLELKPEVADLRQILEHALDACCPPGSPDRPRLLLDIPEEGLRLWADAPRLTQVFWNLLKNALKFSPDGDPVRVQACRDEGRGQLVVEVADRGIGIEPQRLPRIFDAFEQGQRQITRQFGGLGLGLAISKAIVELHGGRITAASEGAGQGTRFTVRLPVGAARLPTASALPKTETGTARSGADRPLHILLVEDHPDTAEAMAELLAAVGHRVTVANSASEALTAAETAQTASAREGIDLVISDVGLPDVSGLELMAQLKSRFRLRGIALSGYGMDEDVQRSRAAGFERHLTKPVNLQILRDTIQQVAGA
jgi:signal transduction histidine kinase/CHASE1-domain containing sensor protein/ActR/RegA family two-component response regulator